MNKNIIIVVVIILVLVGAYFAFGKKVPDVQPENTENGAVTGKIDINAVCEGALAYMTFENGGDAEVFVSECKEGKHPEVIERWKTDNNIDDDRAI